MHRRFHPRQGVTSANARPPQFLHAIPSCQISVDEVPGAQVLHATGNVHHKPDQSLEGQVLVGRQGKLRLDLPTPRGTMIKAPWPESLKTVLKND